MYSGLLSTFNVSMREHLKFYAGKCQANIQIWLLVLQIEIQKVMENGPENSCTSQVLVLVCVP